MIVETHGRLRTVPGKSYFIGEKSQQIVAPAGVSLFWSSAADKYYNHHVVKHLRDQFNAQIVRAAMTAWSSWSTGYIQEPQRYKQHAITIADAAIEFGIYAIIDWHCEGDNSGYVEQAKTFFSEMAQKYASHPNIIYEIWNEPKDQTWNDKIRPYCVEVVKAIRQHDPNNLILCGTQTWSQKVEDAAKNPIPDANLGYVLHFYSNLHGPWLYRNKADLGVPLFVTEWGTPGQHANTKGFVDWLQSKNVPHCSWAANNKNEPLSYFVPSSRNFTGPWNLRTELTSTGNIFLDLLQNWKPSISAPAPNPPAPIARVEAEAYKTSSRNVAVQNKIVQLSGRRTWITYDLVIPRTQVYRVELRLKSPQGGTIRLDTNAGKNVLATITLPVQNDWTTVVQNISLKQSSRLRLGIFTISNHTWQLDSFVLFGQQ